MMGLPPSSPASSASGCIATFASEDAFHLLDDQAVALVTRALTDTVAVAIAARRDAAAEAALRYAQACCGGAAGPAAIWGSSLRLPVEAAAFYNGVAAHLLDYDDVTYVTRGHVSVALVPALLALAQAEGVHSRRLLAAYVVGFEVACQLGRWLGQGLYEKGWHPTSVIGVVAATAACGHLLGLEAGALRHAIGLAVAQASGTRASFGTLAKPFHVGHCAVAALRAVALSRSGFTSSDTALDGDAGMAWLYAGVRDVPHGMESLGKGTLELFASGMEIKRYPNCFATHGAIDALRALRTEYAFQLGDVRQIEVLASAQGLRPLMECMPETGLESKFSMAHALAVVLVEDAPRLASFSDLAVARDDLRALRGLVTARENDGPTEPLSACVTVTLNDGRKVAKTSTLQASSLPIERTELEAKVADCFAWGDSKAEAQPFVARMLALPEGELHTALQTAVG